MGMASPRRSFWLAGIAFLGFGSAGFAEPAADSQENAQHESRSCRECRRAKTLCELILGPRLEADEEEEEEQEEPLAADRPDFVEASSNVGRGRVQLEAGYTFIQDRSGGATTRTHSFPEVLVRIGLFADWLELRVGQNFGVETVSAAGTRRTDRGGEDLYLGVGLALTEQKRWLPESRVVLQTRVPSGAEPFSGDEMLPGVNLLYGWTVIEDRLTLGMSTAFNRRRDDVGDFYLEFAQAATTGITLTEKLGLYLEVFALMPAGATAPATWPETYFDGGFIFRVNNNLQFDIRAGVGISRSAADFFAGSGFAVRF
jgi:hypothetical protein